MAAFHGDINMAEIIRRLVLITQSQHIIESGTYEGDSTRAFAKLVKRVDTIEIREDFFKKAKSDGIGFDNIFYHLDSSANLMPGLLKEQGREGTIFFLDAHWQDNWPLKNELEAILDWRKNTGNECTIIIDDFQHPIRKGFYGSNGGGGTVGDPRYGPRFVIDDTPCDMNTFGNYLRNWYQIWLPCYADTGVGYVIVSDDNLEMLKPLAEKYNYQENKVVE